MEDVIKIFPLGGLGEIGKNMYIVDVNRQLFIFDAGLKYPTSELYGISEIIPDYKFLVRYKDRIRGMFLTTAHEAHIGAVYQMMEDLNVPIYGTEFTLSVLKEILKDNGVNLNSVSLNVIDKSTLLRFNDVRISFFSTSHSIPESIGIALQTISGTIVYTSRFTFEQHEGSTYVTDYSELNKIASKGVLALLIDSTGAKRSFTGGLLNNLSSKLSSIFQLAEGRVFVSIFETDILKINMICKLAKNLNKKVAFLSKEGHKIIGIARRMGYIDIDESQVVVLAKDSLKENNSYKDLIVIVNGTRIVPFKRLKDIAAGKDSYLYLKDNDTVVMLTPPILGLEKEVSNAVNLLSQRDIRLELISAKSIPSTHASADEIKMMINLLKPKYIIPVCGDYQYQYQVSKLGQELGYDEKHILLLDVGDILVLDDKPRIGKGDLRLREIYIDGTQLVEGNDYVMRDREQLATDGILIVNAHIDIKKKELIGDIDLISKGFLYSGKDEELIELIKKTFNETFKQYTKQDFLNSSDLNKEVKQDLVSAIYSNTKRSPIIIPNTIIIDSESEL